MRHNTRHNIWAFCGSWEDLPPPSYEELGFKVHSGFMWHCRLGVCDSKPTWLKNEGIVLRDTVLAVSEQTQIIWRVIQAFQNGVLCLWAAAFKASENQRAPRSLWTPLLLVTGKH